MAAQTILIVEDNVVNQKLLLVLLRTQDYQLITAQDGEEAVAVAARELPDLILMDLQLPKMSGYTATQIIKSNPETAHISIIALTAHTLPDEQQHAQEYGLDGYITKPINTRTFPDLIKHFLEFHTLE